MDLRQLGSFFLIFLSATTSVADDLSGWLNEQNQNAFVRMSRNISPAGTDKGVVVASPSKQDPDYFYHWVRDAAIIMDVVCSRYIKAKTPGEKAQLERMLFDFSDFSLRNQATSNPSGGPGEPKFHVDGKPFLGPWGRPQDDGPALRALTLIKFAKILILDGKENLVRERLYRADGHSVVKFDLEYVSKNWGQTSFDPWEEIRGHHFFTSMVQRRAMLEGAWLAERLNDPFAASWYRKQAKLLENLIARHWDNAHEMIQATMDRDAGIAYKTSGLDSAVVMGVLQGDSGDGFFSVQDDRVLSTVNKIERAFQALYPINQTGQVGIAIGRYPEDRYDGYSTQGEGNPWIINTATFGEFYHRLARWYQETGIIQITRLNYDFFKGLDLPEVFVGETFSKFRKGAFEEVIAALVRKGDSFLYRVKYHSDAGGVLSEQINRTSGYMQGARDLTWSYGALLSAIEHRKPVAFLAR